jgi:molybdate transport system ATP-binding protein
MLYVSHSISEVMALADSTIVLSEGKRLAHGPTPRVLVDPTLSRIAEFATLENLFDAEVSSLQVDDGLAELRVGDVTLLASDVFAEPGDRVMISIRAGDVILSLDIPSRISARNAIKAVIEEIHPLGQRVLVYTNIGERLAVEITPGSLRELDLRVGQQIYAIIKTNSIMVMEPTQPRPGPGH